MKNKAGKTTTTDQSSLFPRVWILSDGKMGDLVQCQGVAQALGVEAETRIVSPKKPYVWMMPYGPLPPEDQLDKPDSPIASPLPDLVIAVGWRTLAYLRAIKKQRKDKVFTVFLKNPRCRSPYIDLIWAPDHDRLSGPRVISSIASPHRFSPELLATEYGELPDYLDRLPRPLVGVLLGGESKDYRFSPDDCTKLATSLLGISQTGAGLMITPSRRSSELLKNTIKQQLVGQSIYWWDEREPNPYGYILAHSDYFVVTADSANMVGEASVGGKPIYVFRPTGGSKKFDRLLDAFETHGAVKPLPERITELKSWHYEALFAADEIARETEQRARSQWGKG